MEKTINQKIKDKIRLLRRDKGFSQEYVAAMLNISQSYYGRIENDKRTISVNCLMKILSVLKVDYNTFFDDMKNS